MGAIKQETDGATKVPIVSQFYQKKEDWFYMGTLFRDGDDPSNRARAAAAVSSRGKWWWIGRAGGRLCLVSEETERGRKRNRDDISPDAR
jgi:hypothetical protein